MAKKKLDSRNRVRRQPVGRTKKRPASVRADVGVSRRLLDLREQIDIVLPEVTARVAALEHLLLELNVCTRDDLRRAREFVRMQEA
jgi:Holliday junction resolvasome RuvABC endonuclease subunit